MARSTALFAIGAICLLLSAFIARRFGPALAAFHVAHRGYGFPPSSVFVFMAALLCGFAAVYSLYLLPMNQKAAVWHFWLTAGGILLFWVGFYSFSALVARGGSWQAGRAVVAIGASWVCSFALIVVAQGIFVANVIAAIMKLRHRG